MVIAMGRLYLLSEGSLKTINIDRPGQEGIVSRLNLGTDVETLYPYQQNLFVGGQSGVRILSLSNPDFPQLISEYSHAWQCDPVVVQDQTAYVTLRGGGRCPGRENRLDVLDVGNIEEPVLAASYGLINPYGLAIDGSTLFVADGFAGLKVFDVGDPADLRLIAQFPDIDGRDVIVQSGLVLVLSVDGLYEFDYRDVEAIEQIGALSF